MQGSLHLNIVVGSGKHTLCTPATCTAHCEC